MNLSDLLKTKAAQRPENLQAITEAAKSAGGLRRDAPVGFVVGMDDPQRKPDAIPALDPRAKVHPSSKGSVAVVVTIVSCRTREVDEDNLVAGAKPLQDAIAKSLGVDDRDRRIKWEYRQIIGEGPEGTLVKINTIK